MFFNQIFFQEKINFKREGGSLLYFVTIKLYVSIVRRQFIVKLTVFKLIITS